MMMTISSSSCSLLLLLLLASTRDVKSSSAVIEEQRQELQKEFTASLIQNQLVCFLAAGTTHSLCDHSTDIEGFPCTWCSTDTHGICVSNEQSELVSILIPDAKCENNNQNNNNKKMYDPICLSAESQDCETTVGNDGSACVWCDAAGVFGLCLSSVQAKGARAYLDCNSLTTTLEKNIQPQPLWDCLSLQEQTDCQQNNNEHQCVWCNTMNDQGMCVSDEAAGIAMNYNPYLHCDISSVTTIAKPKQLDPNDLQECLMLSDAQGCNADSTCSWCSAAGYSMCVTADIADMAAGLAPLVQCGESVMQPDPDDLQECLMLSDAQGCDADDKCTFCMAFGFGVCVTDDVADMASGLAPLVQCDSSATLASNAKRVKVATISMDPNDLQECLMLSDAQGCNADSTCSWCSAAGYSMCVTADIADMAAGLAPLVQCGESVMQPDPDDLQECLMLSDAQGCDADDKCTFCMAFGFGVCVTDDVADMASGLAPLVQCDSSATLASNAMTVSGHVYASSCVAAGYLSLAEEKCKNSVDHYGISCLWCSATTGNPGICLNQNQSNYAGQFLSCDFAQTMISLIE